MGRQGYGPARGFGYYMTKQETTAAAWADLQVDHPGGPAIVTIAARRRDLDNFAVRHGIVVEQPMITAHPPGATETRIPIASLPEFNAIAKFASIPYFSPYS